MSTVSEAFKGICLSVYLSQESPLWEGTRSSRHRSECLKRMAVFFTSWAVALSFSLLVFKMKNTDSGLVLGSVLRSKRSNNFLRESYSEDKSLETYAGVGGLRYIFWYIGAWFSRQRKTESVLGLCLCCHIRLGESWSISAENTAKRRWPQMTATHVLSAHPLPS